MLSAQHDALSSAPNSAMAIFANGDAMNRFLHECPLTFEIDRTEREEAEEDAAFEEISDEEAEYNESTIAHSAAPPTTGDELSRPRNSLTDSIPSSNAKQPRTSTPTPKKTTYLTRPQVFRINADIWRGKHRDWLERHPFWGNFQPKRQTTISQDLGKRVPLVGLSDIDANARPEIPIRILNRRREAQERRLSVRDMVRELRGNDEGGRMSDNGERGGSMGHWG